MFPDNTNSMILLRQLHDRSLDTCGLREEGRERLSVLFAHVEDDNRSSWLIKCVIEPPSVLECANFRLGVVNGKLFEVNERHDPE
jgi:hypothetical protein